MRGEDGKPGKLEFSEPKNSSKRTIGLPQRAASALRSYRKRQLEEEKLEATSYDDQGLVFATAKGTPLDAQNVANRHYKPLLKRAGLPPIRFHNLRHSCLSLLASAANPYGTFRPSPGTRLPRLPSNATPTTTILRRVAPPT